MNVISLNSKYTFREVSIGDDFFISKRSKRLHQNLPRMLLGGFLTLFGVHFATESELGAQGLFFGVSFIIAGIFALALKRIIRFEDNQFVLGVVFDFFGWSPIRMIKIVPLSEVDRITIRSDNDKDMRSMENRIEGHKKRIVFYVESHRRGDFELLSITLFNGSGAEVENAVDKFYLLFGEKLKLNAKYFGSRFNNQ